MINHHDLRQRARDRLPRVLFDFIDGGVEGEKLLAANRAAFDTVTFRTRRATRVVPDLATSVVGVPLAFPVMIAPCGPARIVHPGGDCALARAANGLGTGHVVPHMGGHLLEDIRAASQGPLFYQIYNVGGREIAEQAVRRAAAAGYQALVVTVDNPGVRRERDERNRLGALLSGSLARSWPHIPPLLAKPRWLTGFVLDGRPTASPNAQKPDGTPLRPDEIMAAMARGGSTFAWEDFAWLRQAWPGPIIAKGIVTGDDAKRAVDAGASAVIISNHGGRSLDGEPPTLTVLPEVVAAVGDRAEVLLDSGIRRGSDVVKALALGARAVLVGRLTLYGLATGEAGAAEALAMLKGDIARTMVSIGCAGVAALDRSYVSLSGGRADH